MAALALAALWVSVEQAGAAAGRDSAGDRSAGLASKAGDTDDDVADSRLSRGREPSIVASDALPGTELVRFGRGAWTYFSDPRSVSDAGRTYAGWISPGGWVTVGSYEWATRSLRTVRLGPRLGKDDHNNPALVLRRDGRLTVFYSAHSGPGLKGSTRRRMFMRTTLRVGSIARWSSARAIGVNVHGGLGYTYPSPIVIGDSIWLAWRGANWFPTAALFNGRRWSRARNIVTAGRHSRTRVRGDLPHRPYTKYAAAAGGRIHMAYTDGHPYEDRTNLYYMSIDPRRGTLAAANGRRIGRIGRRVGVRAGQRVSSWHRHGNTWVMDVADDGSGRPVIVYSTGWNRKRKVAFRYARWTGRNWLDRFLAWASDAPRGRRGGYGHRFFSGGVTIDRNDPHRLYVSRGVGDGYRVEVWTLDSDFKNPQRQIVSPPGASCFRPTGSVGSDHRVVAFLCGIHRGWKRFNTKVYLVRYGANKTAGTTAMPSLRR